jgi:hypothetical protein
MLRGPAQWGNVEAIMAMPAKKVIQGEWLWYHSAVDDRFVRVAISIAVLISRLSYLSVYLGSGTGHS